MTSARNLAAKFRVFRKEGDPGAAEDTRRLQNLFVLRAIAAAKRDNLCIFRLANPTGGIGRRICRTDKWGTTRIAAIESRPNRLYFARSPYFLLLLARGTLLLVYPFWDRDLSGLATLDILLWGVMLSSLYVLSRDRRLFLTAALLALGAFAGDLATYLAPSKTALFVSCLLDLIALLFVTSVIIGSVMQPGRIGVDKIFGAVCGHLLLGLVWALGYGALEISQPGSFSIGESTTSTLQHRVNELPAPHFADLDEFIYFSLVTLSTLGYGDMVATTRAARSLAALEAVVGQLYLAVLVARLIGLHIREARGRLPSPRPCGYPEAL